MNSQEVNHNRVGCCMTTPTTAATTTTNKESLLGRRRQIQLQQQREDEGRHPKMMTMLTMRHKSNTKTSSTTTTTSNVIPRNNYVERLSVQLPVSPVQQQQQQRDPSGVGDDDVLRLVIHVEETQPDDDDDDEEEEEEEDDDDPDEKESFLIGRKVGGSSWNEKENRRMLKNIGRQRSASLEFKAGIITTTPPPRCHCPASTEDSTRLTSFDDDEKTCPSVVIPSTPSVADRLSPGSHGQCHNSSSIRNAVGRSNVVVKEFRRSSELLRNILLSLSASSASSRRSSDGSTVSSFSTAAAAHSPSGPQQQQQQQQQTFLSAAESTSYYSSALQAHRKRRWTTNNAPQDNSDATTTTTTTTTLGSSGHAGHTGLLLLFDAIASSNWTLTSQLLDSGVVTDVNAPLNESNGYTALHWCSVQTPVPWPAVFLLLENGCRVEQRDKDGTQPVFLVPNLPKIQQQLVNDAFDYLVRGGVDLPPPVTERDRKGLISDDGEEADPDQDAPVVKSSSGMGSCAGVGSAGGVAAGVGGGGAVNNIFRRLQQSVIINQAGHYLHQHTTGSGANVNKKTLHDASSISPSAVTSTSIDYDPFEITSIKV